MFIRPGGQPKWISIGSAPAESTGRKPRCSCDFFCLPSSCRPVVSPRRRPSLTGLPEVERYRDVAFVAHSTSDFLSGVERALGERDDELRRRRMQIAAENTWTLRAGENLGILATHLPGT